MTSGYEPVLHALWVEPQVAHPGDAVQLTFRAQNLSSVESAAGTVRFLLPAGFEPIGEGESSVAVAAVPPGAELTAQIGARLLGPLDDGTALTVQAVLEAGGTSYGTNLCTVVACSRPILDGPGSGVFIESIDAQTVRVRAVVTNEGDGPAYDVQLALPAPLGTQRSDDHPEALVQRRAESRAFAKIDVGERVEVAFEARIVAPIGVVRADDASIGARGRRRPLPARTEVVVDPDLARPQVAVAAEAGRLQIAVAVRNDGWADARDVRIAMRLPSPLEVPAGSVVVDGARLPQRSGRRRPALSAFARFEPAASGAAIVIDRVPARSTMHVHCSAGGNAAAISAELGVTLTGEGFEHTTLTPFTLEPVRDVRARIVGAPRSVAPGETAAIVIEVVNCGDVAEKLELSVDSDATCDCVPSLSIDPGHLRLTTLVAHVPQAARCDGLLLIGVSCGDAGGERARVEAAIAVRDFPQQHPPGAPETPHLHGAPDREAATVRDPGEPPLRAALTAPSTVTAGESFVVGVDVEVRQPIDVLTFYADSEPGARYVCGSTTVDGRLVLDRDSASALHGAGLRLYDVPAGTRVRLAWSLIVDVVTGGPLHIGGSSDADGVRAPWEPAAITAHAGDAFAVRPAGVAYHVDARTVSPATVQPELRTAPPGEAAPRAVETEVVARLNGALHAPSWSVRVDGARADVLERALGSLRGNTLASHVLALRTFLPDGADSDDSVQSLALAELHAAVESVFERLAIKLRIPGFNVDCSDLEDPAMRRALVALFTTDVGRAIRLAPPSDGPPLDGASLDSVPFGAPAALRAIIALTPARCDVQPPFVVALRRYARCLDAVLATFEGVALPFFEDALMHDAGPALAEARAAALAQLRAATSLVGAAS